MKVELPDEIRALFAKCGRKGGLSTSPDKKSASRLNGRKGGRPKKDK